MLVQLIIPDQPKSQTQLQTNQFPDSTKLPKTSPNSSPKLSPKKANFQSSPPKLPPKPNGRGSTVKTFLPWRAKCCASDVFPEQGGPISSAWSRSSGSQIAGVQPSDTQPPSGWNVLGGRGFYLKNFQKASHWRVLVLAIVLLRN